MTYDGNEAGSNNFKTYLTDMGTDALPDTSATIANLVHTGTRSADLTAATGDFAIGAESRGTQANSASQFLGLLDEVRISDIARGPNEFIFVPEPSTYLLAGVALAGLGLIRKRRVK